MVNTLLSLHSLCSRTKTVNSNWLGTKEKQGATLSIIIFKSKILFNLIKTTTATKTKLGNIWLTEMTCLIKQIRNTIKNVHVRTNTCKHLTIIFLSKHTFCCAFRAVFGYKNLFNWFWIDFETSEFLLPCSIQQDSQNIADDYTSIEPHHEVENNTTTPK